MNYGCTVDEYGNPHYDSPYGPSPLTVRAPGQEYVHQNSLVMDGNCGVALTFDSHEELLWTGSQGGYVTSYYSSALQKYTSFRVSSTHEIKQIETIDHGVLALTAGCLRLYQRRGLQIFNFNFEETQESQCMLTLPNTGHLLIGGQQLFEVDISQGGELLGSVADAEESFTHLRSHPRFICSGEVNGKISLLDPSSLQAHSTIETHSAVLSDFDVRGNLLVSCGFSNRHGSLSVDRFLMLYDLRMMKALLPIQVMFPPFRVRFLPAFSSRLCVVSQTGQYQLLDTDTASTSLAPFIHSVDPGGAALLSFATSASCQALAFADSSCCLHLFGASDEISFNSYSHPTQFADHVEQVASVDITDEITPLSTIPTPYCHEGKRLSDWPLEYSKVVYRPPPLIDPKILSTMKMVGPIGYAPNLGNRRRNQVAYSSDKKGNGRNHAEVRKTPNKPKIVPTRYLRIEAKYSRMGIEEFDFNLYNNTCFAGLEANLPNCYCNNLIQVLYFIEPLRCALLSHVCHREFCLACELGFLFHMLDTSHGMPCQASNFLRAFRTIPEASALGLILPESDESQKKVNFQLLVQSWIRFILQQIHMETTESINIVNNGSSRLKFTERRKAGQKVDRAETVVSPISQIFGSKMASTNICKCRHERETKSTTLLCSLVYPDQYPGKPLVQVSFASILENSLRVELKIPAWCDTCEKYQTMVQTKRLESLPDVLIVNSGLDNQQDVKFWQSQIKVTNLTSGSLTEYGMIGSGPSRKPCRYGDLCTRFDCRFSHPRDKSKRSSPLPTFLQTPSPTSENKSWLPLDIKIKLEADGEIGVVCGSASLADTLTGSTIPSSEISETLPTDEKEDGKEDVQLVITTEDKKESCEEGPIYYELTAVAIVVRDASSSDKDSNIVSLVRVGPISHVRHRGGPATQWYLFNDFTIVPIAKEEATFLNFDWKLPCLLFYSRKNMNERHSLEVLNPLSREVFREDVNLATSRGRMPITFTPLQPEEEATLMPGDIVAMDAEFVTLNQEEAEIRSDGTRSTIRPSQMSVARISCVRGQGPLEGVPFIDDYISTQEQVVDYLTKFSGIQPGDLDASLSSKHLTTLKATYKKLRYLINMGVKFVGHGLKNDFRVINLVVPVEQVIDTVFLFQLPNKRMVSLRFLAWHFLGIKIQAETHDSIEDAKTALRLYREYQRLEKEGKITEALKELYEKGRLLQWKVPSVDEE